MSFNYDLSSSDSNIVLVSKIRLRVGDTIENRGPRPGLLSTTNFSDEEILSFYADEGSNRQRAAAGILEALASEWGKRAGFRKTGPESEDGRQAEFYTKEAAKLRDLYGSVEDEAKTEKQAGFSIRMQRAGNS